MVSSLRSFVLVAFTCLMGTVGHAGVFYECDMDVKLSNGWVSPKIGFVFDDEGRVTVIDSVILNFIGDPISARVSGGPEKYRIAWNVAGARDSKGQVIPTFRYVANLEPAKRKVFVSAKPARAPQRWTSRGTCQPRTPRK